MIGFLVPFLDKSRVLQFINLDILDFVHFPPGFLWMNPKRQYFGFDHSPLVWPIKNDRDLNGPIGIKCRRRQTLRKSHFFLPDKQKEQNPFIQKTRIVWEIWVLGSNPRHMSWLKRLWAKCWRLIFFYRCVSDPWLMRPMLTTFRRQSSVR